MTEGTPWKHILKFVFHVLAGSLLQQLYSTVDTIIVGNFSGEAALSAVGTTGSFIFMFLAAATGFSAGNGVVVAQCYGAGDQKQVKNAGDGAADCIAAHYRICGTDVDPAGGQCVRTVHDCLLYGGQSD